MLTTKQGMKQEEKEFVRRVLLTLMRNKVEVKDEKKK